MNAAAVATELRRLAQRVECLSPPYGPRFREERSDTVRDIRAIANSLAPEEAKRKETRFTTSTLVVNGRRITVQRPRNPFAVFV